MITFLKNNKLCKKTFTWKKYKILIVFLKYEVEIYTFSTYIYIYISRYITISNKITLMYIGFTIFMKQTKLIYYILLIVYN